MREVLINVKNPIAETNFTNKFWYNLFHIYKGLCQLKSVIDRWVFADKEVTLQSVIWIISRRCHMVELNITVFTQILVNKNWKSFLLTLAFLFIHLFPIHVMESNDRYFNVCFILNLADFNCNHYIYYIQNKIPCEMTYILIFML